MTIINRLSWCSYTICFLKLLNYFLLVSLHNSPRSDTSPLPLYFKHSHGPTEIRTYGAAVVPFLAHRGSSLHPTFGTRLDLASGQVRRSRYQPFCRRALPFLPCSSQGEHASSASTSSDSSRTPPSDAQFLLPSLFRILSSLFWYLTFSIWPSVDQD